MKFSRSTAYGLRALANLVLSGATESQKVKSLKEIAKEEHISLKYLEQLFAGLKKAEIIKSTRGAKGGYYLQKKIKEVNLLTVLEALGENVIIFQCLKGEGDIKCSNSNNCGAVPVLQKVQISITNSLKEMTLQDLI